MGDVPGLAIELEETAAVAVAMDDPFHRCRQQYQPGPPLLQPGVAAAVDLQQRAPGAFVPAGPVVLGDGTAWS